MDNVTVSGSNEASRVSSSNDKKPEVFKDAMQKISRAVTRMYDAMQSVQTKIYDRSDTAQTVATIVRDLEAEFQQMDRRLGTPLDPGHYGGNPFMSQGMKNTILNHQILGNCFKEEDELELESHEECQLQHHNGDPSLQRSLFGSYGECSLMHQSTGECFPGQEGLSTQKPQDNNESSHEMNDGENPLGSEKGCFSKQEILSTCDPQNRGSYTTCENPFLHRDATGCALQQKNIDEWLSMQQEKFGGCSFSQQAKCGGCSMPPGYFGGSPYIQEQYGGFPFQPMGYGGYAMLQRYYGGYAVNQGGYGDYPFQHGIGNNFLPKNVQYIHGPTPGSEWRVEAPVKVSIVTTPRDTVAPQVRDQENPEISEAPKSTQKMEASVQVKLDEDSSNITFVDSRTDAPMDLRKAEVSVQVSPESPGSTEENRETNDVKYEAISTPHFFSKAFGVKVEGTGDPNPKMKNSPSRSLIISLPHCLSTKRKLRPPGMSMSVLRRCSSRFSMPTASFCPASVPSSPAVQCPTIAWARPRAAGLPKPKPRPITSVANLPCARSTTRISGQSPTQHFPRPLLAKLSTASINDEVTPFPVSRTRSPSPTRHNFPLKPMSAQHRTPKRKRQLEQLGKLLLKASQEGRMKDVRILLKQGANPNYPNKRKWTPLHMASLNCHSDVVSLLLERGADVNARNTYGFSALHMAAYNDHSGDCVSRLIYAGCDLDCGNYSGRRALHFAAEYGNEAAVRALLAAGACKNVKNDEGLTPLDVANCSVRRLLAPDSGQGKRDVARD